MWADKVVNNAQNHVNITNCSYYNTITDIKFLVLNITWPSINNTKQMDFDSYKVLIEIFKGTQKLSDVSCSEVTTTVTFYENILRVSQTQVSSNLEAHITIIATNKCNNSSMLQVNHTLTEGNIMISNIHEILIIIIMHAHHADKCSKYTLVTDGAQCHASTSLSYEISIVGLCLLLLFLA